MIKNYKCPHCGAELHDGASFCPYCMRTLIEKREVPVTVIRKRNVIWVFVTILLCISIASVTFYYIYRYSEKQDPGYNGSDGSTSGYKQLVVLTPTTDVTGQTANKETDSFASDAQETENSTEPSDNKSDVSDMISGVQTTEKEWDEPTEPVPSEELVTNPTVHETTVPDKCEHLFNSATCVSPQTCSACGEIRGDINTNGHNWVSHVYTVNHDEVGHWEETEVLIKEYRYLCFYCGYNQEGYVSYDSLRDHMGVHSNKSDYQYVLSKIESLSDVREVWVPVKETKWVVDQQAYTETITEYTCTYCGKSK